MNWVKVALRELKAFSVAATILLSFYIVSEVNSPVVSDMKTASWGIASYPYVLKYSNGKSVLGTRFDVSAELYGEKLRNCTYITTFSKVKINGRWTEDLKFEYVNDATPNSTRPKGLQYFGVGKWSVFNIKPKEVSIHPVHSCIGESLSKIFNLYTHTEIKPFVVPTDNPHK